MLMLKSTVVLVNVILETGASNILVYNAEIILMGWNSEVQWAKRSRSKKFALFLVNLTFRW